MAGKINYQRLWVDIITEYGEDAPSVMCAHHTAQQLRVLPGGDWWRALVETFRRQQDEG